MTPDIFFNICWQVCFDGNNCFSANANELSAVVPCHKPRSCGFNGSLLSISVFSVDEMSFQTGRKILFCVSQPGTFGWITIKLEFVCVLFGRKHEFVTIKTQRSAQEPVINSGKIIWRGEHPLWVRLGLHVLRCSNSTKVGLTFQNIPDLKP